LPRSRLKFTITIVVLFVFVSVVNWISDQAALQIVALFIVQPVLLILALEGIRINRVYTPRLRITWRKSFWGTIMALVVVCGSIGILALRNSRSVYESYYGLWHMSHAPWIILFQTLLMLILAGAAEELLFRGYIFEFLNSDTCHLGILLSSVVVGLLFGTFHAVHDMEAIMQHQTTLQREWITIGFQYTWGFTACLMY
jgi:membrane protease YdiL (CAAX protease family)